MSVLPYLQDCRHARQCRTKPKAFPWCHDSCRLWGQRARPQPVLGPRCRRVLLEVPARGHLTRGVPQPGESEMTAGEGRSEGLTGKQLGRILGRLASTGSGKRWGRGAPCQPLRVREPKPKPVRTSGKEAGGDERSARPGKRRPVSAVRAGLHWHRETTAAATAPVPPSATARSRPPEGSRPPRASLPSPLAALASAETPEESSRRRGRAASTALRARARSRGVEEIQSKAGGCPKWLSRPCRDTDGLGGFVEIASCSPILSPRPRPLCQAPAEKTIHRPTHCPRIRQGFNGHGPRQRGRSLHDGAAFDGEKQEKSPCGSSDCTASSPLPAPVNSAGDPGPPAGGDRSIRDRRYQTSD